MQFLSGSTDVKDRLCVTIATPVNKDSLNTHALCMVCCCLAYNFKTIDPLFN